jgi:hypothetical protein
MQGRGELEGALGSAMGKEVKGSSLSLPRTWGTIDMQVPDDRLAANCYAQARRTLILNAPMVKAELRRQADARCEATRWVLFLRIS